MGERKRKSEWQVIRLRYRGEYLGTVVAPDEQSAIRAAIKVFDLTAAQANSIMVRQCR